MGVSEPSGLWSSSPTTVTTSSSTESLAHPLASPRPWPWLPSSGLMLLSPPLHLSSDGAPTSQKVSLTPAPPTTCPRTSTTGPTESSSSSGATLCLFPASSTPTSSSSSPSLLTNLP